MRNNRVLICDQNDNTFSDYGHVYLSRLSSSQQNGILLIF